MKRLAYFILVLTAIVALTWLLLQRPKSAAEDIVVQPEAPLAMNKPVVEPVPMTSPAVAKTNSFVRPPNIDEVQWDRLMSLRQALLERNQPVEFYARVIDQKEQPVEGARLALKLARVDEALFTTTNFFGLKLGKEIITEEVELFSDAQGWLKLRGVTGFSLYVTKLSKEGYLVELPPHAYGSFSYEPGGRRNAPSGTAKENDAYNSTKGYTFNLWKKGETEPLVRVQTGASLLRPKTNAMLNLVSGRVAEAAVDGDLEIQVEYLFPNDPNKLADRRIHLRGLNGLTLVETAHPYPYSAVETDYVPALYYDALPSQGHGPGGTWGWKKNFYVVARGGRIRGAIRIDFNSGEMNFGISGYLNPAGSLNLEPDADKQITDPAEIRRLDEATRLK